MLRALSIIFATCLFTLPVVARQSLDANLWQAASDGDSVLLEELVGAHRLEIKPILESWIVEALRESDTRARKNRFVGSMHVATVFATVFGETSLEYRVHKAMSWNWKEGRVKVLADSVYADAVSRRGISSERPAVLESLLDVEEQYRSIDDNAGLAATLGQLGYISWFLDRDAYLTYNQAALELRREIGDLQLTGNTLNDLGLYFRAISRDYPAALEVYLESETIRWAIGDSVALSRTLPNIALSHEYLGDFDSALSYYEKGAQLYWAVGDTARYITQRNNAVGVLTDYQERHSDALMELLGLKQEMKAINDPRTEALVTNQLGIVSRRLGDFQNAIVNYQDVIRLSKENGFDDLLAGAQNNIGVAFLYMGRSDRAIPYFERAYQEFETQQSYEGALETLINLGSANFEVKNYPVSTNHLEEAQRDASAAEDRLSLGTIEVLLGNSRLYGEGPEAAEPHFETALDIARDYEIPDLTMTVLFGLGDMAELAGRPDEALSRYEEGFTTLESARGLLLAEEDKAGYIAQTRYLFEDVIDFLTRQAIETGEQRWIESAFNFSEQARARAFVDQLAEAIAGVNSGVDADLLEDQASLIDNLIYLRDELAVETDRDGRNELKALIREQEEDFDRVERDLRSKNTSYADLRYPEAITLADLQNAMGEDELILSYSVGDSSSTLWGITQREAIIRQLPTRSELSDQIDILRFALQDPSRVTADGYGETASSLYNTLVGPAADLLPGAKQIIIIPDGVLNYVPFEALVSAPDTSWSRHEYMLAGADISYVQSATVLSQLNSRAPVVPTMEFLAVGNPDFGGTNSLSNLRGASLQSLPFSGEEVNGISSLFTAENQDIFTGVQATESAIQDAVVNNHYRYVHFATHGLINDDRPDYSALALAQGSTRGEGLLQASEIFNLPFQSDLVVLSACETGLGQLIQGEGMVGLTRAFMYAGASSLVVSLWSVADASTAELMQHFYKNLVSESMDKTTALREAKRTLIETASTSHPFYWAPFVLVGRTL